MITIFFWSRLVKDFNKINRFSIVGVFLWAILAECSLLLTLQFQLVKYLILILFHLIFA